MSTRENRYKELPTSSRYTAISPEREDIVQPVASLPMSTKYPTTTNKQQRVEDYQKQIQKEEIVKKYERQGRVADYQKQFTTPEATKAAGVKYTPPKLVDEMKRIQSAPDYEQPGVNKAVKDILNNPKVAPVMQEVARRTSGTGIYSMIKAVGPQTFDEAYQATRAYQAGDKSKLNKFLYQLSDAAPQTLIGVGLNFIPYAGKPLSTAYWTALSANEQQENRGQVESLGNIAVDVALDSVLGSTIEGLFKTPAKSLLATMTKTFTAEGGTEVAQDLLKMGNDYRNAKTSEEKARILQEGKDYFTSGQILITAGVGGLLGAGIGAGAYGVNKSGGTTNIQIPDVFYSGAKGEVTEAKLDLDNKKVITLQGDQRALTNSNSFVEADNKLVEQYSPNYDVVKIEHPELPQKGDEYLVLSENKWYSPDKNVAEIYAMQNREGKYPILEQEKMQAAGQDDVAQTAKEQDILAKEQKGPGYQKFSNYVDTMEENGTIFPEESVVLKTIFEGTDDGLLGLLNFKDNSRLTATLGHLKRRGTLDAQYQGYPKLEMMKGQAIQHGVIGGRTFAHEFGHAGYWFVLTADERAVVDDVFNSMSREEKVSIFRDTTTDPNYYAKNSREFFAQSFADYVFENKVPAKKMEPILKRVAKVLYDRIKNLVTRNQPKAVKAMSPLFEKILSGDKSTPLGEFVAQEPPSFKEELKKMFEKPLFQGATKQVPVEEIMPQEGDSPSDMAEEVRTKAVQGLPPDIISTIEPIETVIEGERNTPLEQRVRWIDYLRTPWKVFDRMGIRPQYQKLLKAYEGYVAELPKNIDKITAWSKRVNAEGNEKIFRYLDGEEISLTAEEMQVAEEVKAWLKQWADRLGMSPDRRISEYITHIFPLGQGGEIPEEISYIIDKKVAGSVYNPFLLQRKGAEGYLKNTWKALDAYAKRATRKVHMDPALEELKQASTKLTDTSQLNYLVTYASAINLRPTAIDTAIDNHIKEKFGYAFGTRPTAHITRMIRRMIARSKIGGSMTSLAKNLTQGVNTFAELGTRATIKGYMDLVKKGGKELDENGVLIAPFIEDRTYSAVKKAAERFDKVLFFNMNASEFINRGAAYYGAKDKFIRNKINAKEFKLAFGKAKPANYQPTMEDAITYGKFISAKTQFLFGPLDTPVGLTSDLAKMTVQFQTFGIKQFEFMGQMIGQKEYYKLLRYLASSMLLFAYIGRAFGMSWDDSFKTFRFGMPPAIQFFLDLFNLGVLGKDKYGNELDMGQRAKAVGRSLFTNVVPAGAQMLRTQEGLSTVGEGKGRSAAGKFQYKVEQTPGNYIRGGLFGKYNLPASQEYYEKRDAKAKGKSSDRSDRYKAI